MKRLFAAVAVFAWLAIPAYATECETALFHPVYGVFAHEGGYQNSEHDAGNWSSGKVGVGHLCGGTKYGQSCASNPGVDIKNLDKSGAAVLYEKKECRTTRLAGLKGQRVPTLYLDLAVNMGDGTAVKLFHRLRNRLNATDEKDVPVTTVMTDDDVTWFNSYTRDFHQRREFLFGLALVGIDHYTDIVESNPKQARWLLGWITRVNPLND